MPCHTRPASSPAPSTWVRNLKAGPRRRSAANATVSFSAEAGAIESEALLWKAICPERRSTASAPVRSGSTCREERAWRSAERNDFAGAEVLAVAEVAAPLASASVHTTADATT